MAAIAGRRLGPVVAAALLRAAKQWVEDPANDEARRALVAQVSSIGGRLGGASQRLARALVRQIGRTSRSGASTWQNEVGGLRRHLADTPTGPQRAMLADAYVEALSRRPTGLSPDAMAEAYAREAEAVVREPLGPHERQRALDALRLARAGLPRAR